MNYKRPQERAITARFQRAGLCCNFQPPRLVSVLQHDSIALRHLAWKPSKPIVRFIYIPLSHRIAESHLIPKVSEHCSKRHIQLRICQIYL